MKLANLRINIDRLSARIEELAEIGAIAGGGVCRMALTDEDRQGVTSLLNGCMNSVWKLQLTKLETLSVSVQDRNPEDR